MVQCGSLMVPCSSFFAACDRTDRESSWQTWGVVLRAAVHTVIPKRWVTQAVSTIKLWPHSPFTGGGSRCLFILLCFVVGDHWGLLSVFTGGGWWSCEVTQIVSMRMFGLRRLGGRGVQGDQLCWISVWGAWSPGVLMILYFIYVPYGQCSNLGGAESTSPADICQTSQPQFGLTEQQSFKDIYLLYSFFFISPSHLSSDYLYFVCICRIW